MDDVYRQALASAHARIHMLDQHVRQLEAHAREPVIRTPAPTEAHARTSPPLLPGTPGPRTEVYTPVRDQRLDSGAAILGATLAVLGACYAFRFGVTAPAWSIDELLLGERGSLACAALAAVVVFAAWAARRRLRPTVASRLLLVLLLAAAVPVSAPVVLGLLFSSSFAVLITIGGAGIPLCVSLWTLGAWIRRGDGLEETAD